MHCYYAEDQALHAPATMLMRGQVIDSPEGPLRADILCQVLQQQGRSIQEPPRLQDSEWREQLLSRLSLIHTQRYLEFLQTIYARWTALPGASERVTPNTHPTGLASQYPSHPVGLAGWHLSDMATPMTAESFSGILASAASAAAAAERVNTGSRAAYALCRPPGHHAGPESAGGFCFLNNSALAATVLRERYERVAIIDVDLHHGNGTQDIFYHRADVWTGSLHADTTEFYPFFWGGSNEQGTGDGMGYNVNMPLPLGAGGQAFMETLQRLLASMQSFQPQAVVVALGLDAHKDDPLAGLALETDDFQTIGQLLSALQLPTVVVQEGGYPTASLGHNLAAFLSGFTQG